MALPDDLRTFLATHGDALRERLLSWFTLHARDLPWRRDRTPYRVWVAEVMLQQTQAEKVRAYYPRFLARFPTVKALAEAPLEAVLKIWEGLGYYRRARLLHRAAQEIVNRHGGRLPAGVEALRRLPGVGAYTAGAVASLAFDMPVPAVDGNVRRVIARLLALPAPSRGMVASLVEALLPTEGAGRVNEALMELGATLCRPRQPRCPQCPWRDLCRAHRLGRAADFPAPAPRKPLPHYDVAAAVVRREDGRVLVAQRRNEDMLGGLWEFPGGKREAGETLPEALRRELREELDFDVTVGERLITLHHSYTHFRITLHAFLCTPRGGEPRCVECQAFRWVRVDELAALPMAVTDRKIAERVAGR